MTLVVVPVRYPLSKHSAATLREAVSIAEERDADLSVLHVDLFQNNHNVSRVDLKRAAEAKIGPIDRARYVVRQGFLVEETIMEEVADEGADVVVIGSKQAGRFRKMLNKLFESPDVGRYLEEQLDCTVITVSANGQTQS
ncbi:universal stress protein family protein [Halolamina pelagica]|uniref:Universal stress protein family protein n=1 Tax=Halolamina pelagica TaxID=699431 RepID=A0A0P7HRQ6_9EURY|nr:universal stress protein [Halolamina pelagica]KPN29343.1 universal stress protein family protein [Halolamina pelagica]